VLIRVNERSLGVCQGSAKQASLGSSVVDEPLMFLSRPSSGGLPSPANVVECRRACVSDMRRLPQVSHSRELGRRGRVLLLPVRVTLLDLKLRLGYEVE
jgi:hypothetical protein